MISLNQTSATTVADLSSPQQKQTSWPFAATLVCASLLGIIALAFCARTMLPAWALDGEYLSPSVICSSANSQTARTGD